MATNSLSRTESIYRLHDKRGEYLMQRRKKITALLILMLVLVGVKVFGWFLKINREFRKENGEAFHELGETANPGRLWEGNWLRLPNSATMAQFGDRRTYYYHGKEIDKEVHPGLDLASLADSNVPAANNGRVIFAGRMGIYDQTVVLDHGQGLASSYSHLSKIDVAVEDVVRKGATIGETRQTELAGGDHLHFGVMVDGVVVNPAEWWDSHWIADNINKKLALLKN